LSGSIAVIVPVYNESPGIRQHLSYHDENFQFDEIIVVDGGSTDGTRQQVGTLSDSITLITLSPGNRSRQLSEGVRVSRSNWLMFLHADTLLPKKFNVKEIGTFGTGWGWFDCRLDDSSLFYTILSTFITWRSAIFSSPTGDQAIWVERPLLEHVGGIPQVPLMEDVKLADRLRAAQPGTRITQPVRTSPRRWKQNGPFRTILTMWALKVAYYVGVPPAKLAKIYYGRTET
jgi:rSAM/selenodomain-associated transferase 2